MTAEESIQDFKEVTESEWSKIAQTDSAWVRPPQVFIDLWNKACGVWGRYNGDTGYFELNGLTDITYDQALDIYNAGAIDSYDCAGKYNRGSAKEKAIRTNLPRTIISQWGYNTQGFNIHNLVQVPEVFNLEPFWGEDPNGFLVDIRLNGNGVTNNFIMYLSGGGWYGGKLMKRFIGVFNLTLMRPTDSFGALESCNALEDVKISNLGCNILFSQCRKLSLASMQYLVDNAKDMTELRQITITLSKQLYAKVSGDTTSEEVAAMTPEEAAAWQALVPAAAAKNILIVSI